MYAIDTQPGRLWPAFLAGLVLVTTAAPLLAQSTRTYTRWSYTYACGDAQYERYLVTRTRDEAVSRMFWLDGGGCKVESFTRDGDTRNLWPEIRRDLQERRAQQQQQQQQQQSNQQQPPAAGRSSPLQGLR